MTRVVKSGRTVSAALWIAAFLVAVLLAVFQRMTGPSYPARGSAELAGGESITYRLPRSDEGRGTLRVTIPRPHDDLDAVLEWRRFPTDEPYRELTMASDGEGRLVASIPGQPAAAKVEYRVVVSDRAGSTIVPADEPVVARYRGDVPAGVLIPHILAMFGSMLVSTRALFEVLRPGPLGGRRLILTSMGLLVVGGLVLGPIVQKFAFGAFWTGWPFGHDLTDNKTVIAFLAWLPATIAAARGVTSRTAVVLGWVVMMGIFLIPHSMRGSELDWSEMDSSEPQVSRVNSQFLILNS
jgi:hypothetical protein